MTPPPKTAAELAAFNEILEYEKAKPRTQAEVAFAEGYSRSYIRDIERRALEKLRRIAERKDVRLPIEEICMWRWGK